MDKEQKVHFYQFYEFCFESKTIFSHSGYSYISWKKSFPVYDITNIFIEDINSLTVLLSLSGRTKFLSYISSTSKCNKCYTSCISRK